uniref:Uncharacterized protein n=1 Tax=Setaria italica TaxID=4555 RepID=K3ZGV6_SETIT
MHGQPKNFPCQLLLNPICWATKFQSQLLPPLLKSHFRRIHFQHGEISSSSTRVA